MCAHVGAYCIRTPYRPRRGRIIIWGSMGYTFIPCGMFVGRMQYAPTRVHVFDRWMVGMFLGRGILYTPLYHIQRKRAIIRRFLIYPFIPCRMFVGRMQYAPTWVHAFNRWVVRVFSCRGVLHTPPYRPCRGRRIIWVFMGHLFIPCGMFVRRMLLRPTRVRTFDGWVVRVSSRRGVLHTSLYRSRRGRRIIWGFMVWVFIPYGIFVGRMQYAPTRVHAFDR